MVNRIQQCPFGVEKANLRLRNSAVNRITREIIFPFVRCLRDHIRRAMSRFRLPSKDRAWQTGVRSVEYYQCEWMPVAHNMWLSLSSLKKRRLGKECVLLSSLTQWEAVEETQLDSSLKCIVKVRSNKSKMQQKKFWLEIKPKFIVSEVKHRSRLPREAGESPSLEIFKNLPEKNSI